MRVRSKIALTLLATGTLTAVGMVLTLLLAFQRFEHESNYYRAHAFLGRVVAQTNDLLDQHQRNPQEFTEFLRNLALYEPDTQLYLLDAEGGVLAHSGRAQLPAGFKVRLGPVQQAAGDEPMPYVMGDDPERMDSDVVVAARPLRRSVIRADAAVAGYLYLVCHKAVLPPGRWAALRNSFAAPALGTLLALVVLSTLLAAAVVANLTRPLRQLTRAAAQVQREGLPAPGALAALPPAGRDEFGQLAGAFRTMLEALRSQWQALQRLDHFRREGVSNLSHDLRSPLTATSACLETLSARWAGDAQRQADSALLAIALRNTRNAARLVESLGELARLDEPSFELKRERLPLAELLDDIAMRFAARAAAQGVTLHCEALDDPPAAASVDVALFERAVANLVDNALKHSSAPGQVSLRTRSRADAVEVEVADTGAGIAAADLPHLFDRFYQARHTAAPAGSDGGKGLGLAIVKRIVELHGGSVAVESALGQGTTVRLRWPRD